MPDDAENLSRRVTGTFVDRAWLAISLLQRYGKSPPFDLRQTFQMMSVGC
jgi:hypothetical protein